MRNLSKMDACANSGIKKIREITLVFIYLKQLYKALIPTTLPNTLLVSCSMKNSGNPTIKVTAR